MRHITTIILALLLLTTLGCESVEVVFTPPNSDFIQIDHSRDQIDQSVVAEIKAAQKLDFANQQHDALKDIANRHNLYRHSQLALARAAFTLDFSSQQTDILITLANRYDFHPQTKTYILENIDRLDFSSDQRRILKVINNSAAH
ncbi:hypothetical protein KS4_05050 [Poriferisphaera corsica]|uniref:DUF4476 domain-containing protein n=1 Tax=Poriferisphaera corsica TaxID=2528020 RepID=A0A517YQG9_9BACT|nr:hypothetical protein [Poriferisphaera corsica]QDU32473.1 hypothetical protein KS4_05050 [Poriferisphaera corsica]